MPAALTCCNCGHDLTRPDIKPLESPFPDLLNLGSNVVLPSSQTNVIASSISSALRDVSQLDQDSLRLENTIVELCHKRDERRSFAIAHKALISPMRRVPPEIIADVFLYSVEESRKRPISLASICSRWRSIALSSPQLWASFMMSINTNILESQIALAKMWLLRAGKHPLSIDLSAYGQETLTDAAFADVHSLVEVFVARCEQWRTIKLTLPPVITKCLLGVKDRLHRLEKLTFADWDTSYQDFSALFATAPKLRFLRIASLSRDTRPQLPWHQLHELSLNGEHSVHDLLDILETTPSLQKCEFRTGFAETENAHTSSPIVLPMLRCMIIRFFDNPRDLPYFLSAIHMPVLQELAISANPQSAGEAIATPLNFPSAFANAIVAMISHRSLLKLTSGLESTTQITPASTVSILRAAPKLIELSLKKCAASVLSREFVDEFSASNACLVPNLQKLQLENFDGLDIPIALDAIETRCLPSHRNPLKQLILSQHGNPTKPIHPAFKPRLLRMVQSGLDVQLLSYGKPVCL